MWCEEKRGICRENYEKKNQEKKEKRCKQNIIDDKFSTAVQ